MAPEDTVIGIDSETLTTMSRHKTRCVILQVGFMLTESLYCIVAKHASAHANVVETMAGSELATRRSKQCEK